MSDNDLEWVKMRKEAQAVIVCRCYYWSKGAFLREIAAAFSQIDTH